jgi:hypothetical protein
VHIRDASGALHISIYQNVAILKVCAHSCKHCNSAPNLRLDGHMYQAFLSSIIRRADRRVSEGPQEIMDEGRKAKLVKVVRLSNLRVKA